MQTGCAWAVSEGLTFCCEIDKNEKDPWSVKTGLEFAPHPRFTVRAGISGTPLKFTTGAGFQTGKVIIDIAFSYHGSLGYTPSVSLAFSP